jgi:hypothetical protein
MGIISRFMVNGWFILSSDQIATAFIAGTLLAALAGNGAQWRWNRVARLSKPFVDPQNPVSSILRVSIAGPYFLVNEALIAHQEMRSSRALFTGTLVFAILWCLASGILCLEFLWQINQLL